MTDRMRVAVMGAGRNARAGLLSALQARSKVEVVTIVNPELAACWVTEHADRVKGR